MDSGASIHICSDRSMYDTFNEDGPRISISGVSKSRMLTKGVGTVRLPIRCIRTDTIHYLVLDNVYYLPEQSHNLISVRKTLTKYKSADSPHFKKMVWYFGSYKFLIQWQDNMYKLITCDPYEWTGNQYREEAEQAILAAVDSYNCDTLRLSTSEISKYAMMLTPDGKFDLHISGSENLPKQRSVFREEIHSDICNHRLDWNGKSIYGFVPPNLSILERTLEKAHADFIKDDTHKTKQILVVPYLPQSNAWFYAKYYEVIEVYKRVSDSSDNSPMIIHKDDYKLFEHLSENNQIRPVPSNDGPSDYLYVTALPFSYAVLYRDSSTPMQTDDYVKAHLRFGHRSAQYIYQLIKQGIKLGSDIKLTEAKLKNLSRLCHCESCILTRMRRPSFSPNAPGRYDHLKPFEYIVSDITGPISPQAADGSDYVVHFTCVKTRYTWGACMERRSDVLYHFSQFLQFVKNSGYDIENIRFLKTDNAGEYKDGLFKEFCSKNTITKIFTSAYMHEENSIAEVIWRDIAAVARAMLVTAGLPMDLWHLAYDHSLWLRARMPNIENDMKIPFCEIFPNKTLSLEDVRVFGCNAYQWLDSDQRYNQQPDLSKHLQYRSRPLIYVGHSDTSSSWLLYDIDKQTMVLSGKPTFLEQFDKLGRRISDTNLSESPIDQYHTYKQLPPGFKHDVNIGIESFVITDHTVHYDEHEDEITAVVKFNTMTDSEGTWTYLHNVVNCADQYDAVVSYLKNYYSQGNLNTYYPFFSVCSARPGGYM